MRGCFLLLTPPPLHFHPHRRYAWLHGAWHVVVAGSISQIVRTQTIVGEGLFSGSRGDILEIPEWTL